MNGEMLLGQRLTTSQALRLISDSSAGPGYGLRHLLQQPWGTSASLLQEELQQGAKGHAPCILDVYVAEIRRIPALVLLS